MGIPRRELSDSRCADPRAQPTKTISAGFDCFKNYLMLATQMRKPLAKICAGEIVAEFRTDQNFRVVRRDHCLDSLDSRAASLPDIPGKNFHRRAL